MEKYYNIKVNEIELNMILKYRNEQIKHSKLYLNLSEIKEIEENIKYNDNSIIKTNTDIFGFIKEDEENKYYRSRNSPKIILKISKKNKNVEVINNI